MKNGKEIYYQFEDELAHVQAEPISDVAPVISPAPMQTAAAPVTVLSGPANDVLNVLVAQKLKKKVEEMPLSKSIKDLVGGKSILQNEILGDLQMEFMSASEKGEELPPEELGAALGAGHSGGLGLGLVSRMVGGCLEASTSHQSRLIFQRHGDEAPLDRMVSSYLA
jgi:fatty acid synthase subunit beta